MKRLSPFKQFCEDMALISGQIFTDQFLHHVFEQQPDYVKMTGDLADAMRRASVAHGEHEKRMGGEYDVNWPDWYAAYMVAEQSGAELPT